MIASHLVWGAAMAATLCELRRAKVEIFAADAARGSAPEAVELRTAPCRRRRRAAGDQVSV
jgi:hypothetical protein